MQEYNEVMGPEDVARVFGVAAKTVTRWAKDGKLPYFLTPGGHRRFYRKDVMELLEKGRRHAV